MKVSELMTHNVVAISPTTLLQEAADRMRTDDVGVLPICEGSKLVGLITDRDMIVRALAYGSDPAVATVRECMTTELVTCHDDDEVGEAQRLMQEHQVRRIAVLDHEEHLVGIVSLGDIATRQDERNGVARTLELVSEEKV